MSKFQLILLIVFGAFIILAVLIFSFSRGGGSSQANITIWGPLSAVDFNSWAENAGLNASGNITYQYEEKEPASIGEELTEALAVGAGPDLVILPHSEVWKARTKLLLIPYASVSESDYKNVFVEEGELFLTAEGTYALPLFVDPMVLYWNRDLFTKAALTRPIAYWDEIYAASQALTEKDNAGNIITSPLALGETRNIPHAKEILSLLMLQAGTPITSVETEGLRSVLSSNFNLPLSPAVAALDFYTQFSDPGKQFYSWNRSLLPAQTSFISGDSAMYLGFASELPELRAKSPTLNLAAAPVPQSRASGKSLTYGELYGIAISRGAGNPGVSLSAALRLVSRESALSLSELTGFAPVRRDILSTRPSDSFKAVFYEAAIQAKGWRDPDSDKTRTIFTNLIDSVTSGRARSPEAVIKADRELQAIIQNK